MRTHRKTTPTLKQTILKFTMKTSAILVILTITIAIANSIVTSGRVDGIQYTNHSLQGSQKNCSYSIEIETTCAPSAETADPIGVRFSDSAGNLIIVKHLKHPKLLYAPKNGLKNQGGAYSGFERCAVDMFETSGACMSQKVCSLYLKRFGSDGWRPGWVKVFHQQDGGHAVPVSYMFYFRTFVPENVWFGFDYCHSKGGFIPHVATFGEE